MTVAGDCPRCGAQVEPGRARAEPAEPLLEPAAAPGDAAVDAEWVPDLEPIPWHLKMLAGAVAVYLGWRAFQGIEWLVHHL